MNRRLRMVWLPERAQPLFVAMPLDARRHSLNVLATLLAAGYDDPDLCAAALLHDMGKIAAQEAGVGHQPLGARSDGDGRGDCAGLSAGAGTHRAERGLALRRPCAA